MARLISDVPGYRAEKHRREAVYLLAAVVAGLACFSLAPAARHFDLGQAPGWARVVWLLALLQLAYAVWLALAPDWSATWVTTLLLAIVAAIYATAMAITLTVAPGHETILGLSDAVRTSGNKPTLWCGANVLLASLLAYLSGLLSLRWHRAYRRLNAPPSA